DVGVGYAEVLRLPTRKSTREVRVAEQTRGRMTHQLLRELRVPVRCLADGIEAVPARPAAAAGDRERDHDPVAGAQPLHAGTDLLDDAHRLMPEHVPLLHERIEAVIQVEIRATDRGRRDAHDRESEEHT